MIPKLYILGFLLIFIAWLTYELKKHSRDSQRLTDKFWADDASANNVRRVNLDSISYITIPVDSLPFGSCDDTQVAELEQRLLELSKERILNLSNMTSTDIKTTYGAANLPIVSSYDDNFTAMVQTIYELGARLKELQYTAEAIAFLEFGIDSLTDISGNYKLLCQLYTETNQPHKLYELLKAADGLTSLSKGPIIRTIKGFMGSQ